MSSSCSPSSSSLVAHYSPCSPCWVYPSLICPSLDRPSFASFASFAFPSPCSPPSSFYHLLSCYLSFSLPILHQRTLQRTLDRETLPIFFSAPAQLFFSRIVCSLLDPSPQRMELLERRVVLSQYCLQRFFWWCGLSKSFRCWHLRVLFVSCRSCVPKIDGWGERVFCTWNSSQALQLESPY